MCYSEYDSVRSLACVDPESFVGWGPTLTGFFPS